MLQSLQLLLPALMPSWRFFDTIGPSPRIEYALLQTPLELPIDWQEFRPRPARLSLSQMAMRLFWNPRWNESLFLVSCAERLMAHPTEHSSREIIRRMQAEWKRHSPNLAETPYLQFRLVFLSRQGAGIRKEVTFLSPIHRAFAAEAA